MPKGSKKRKAERRKKENGVNSNSPPNGSEDLKSHEDEKIDEDPSSYTATATSTTATSKSQQQHHPLGQKDEETEDSRDALSVESTTSVNNDETIERSEIGGEGEEEVVQSVRVLKLQKEEQEKKIVVIEGGSESRVINIDDVESVKEPNSFGSSSEFGNSSGSSSDEESRSIDKKEDNYNSVKDSSPQVENLTEQQVCSSISEEVTQIIEVTSIEKAEGSGLVVDLPLKETVTVIHAASIIEASNGGEHIKEVKTPEISNNQVVPQIVQPTSWKSCCGLFDVFMGSNR